VHAFLASDFEAMCKGLWWTSIRVFSRSLESILQTMKITNRGEKNEFYIDLISGAILVLST
jgi:hypothetical protein